MNLLNHMIIFEEGNGTPLQYSCLENPMDGGAWWAAIYRVAKSQTRRSASPGKAGISGLHSRLPRGVRPRLQILALRTPTTPPATPTVSQVPLTVWAPGPSAGALQRERSAAVPRAQGRVTAGVGVRRKQTEEQPPFRRASEEVGKRGRWQDVT